MDGRKEAKTKTGFEKKKKIEGKRKTEDEMEK